ncbi:MAG: hypothetical protein H6578_11035 [Chitinophagales bacterium]|nr:hypothetical protein [Chitinophagales bacterium]
MQQNDVYTLEEFIAYIMIYAATADFEIRDKEEKHIKKMVGDATYFEMLDLFETHNDIEALEFIEEQRRVHLNEEFSKENLLHIAKEVFLVDGKFDASEKALYEALKLLKD